jgi:hypothetical protein
MAGYTGQSETQADKLSTDSAASTPGEIAAKQNNQSLGPCIINYSP